MIMEDSAQSRRQINLIREVVDAGGSGVGDLALCLRVSTVTVYRDVAALGKRGLVVLDKGRVSPITASAAEVTYKMRTQEAPAAKASFGPVAADMIPWGASVIVDDSTSVLPTLQVLLERSPLTLITNSVSVLELASSYPTADVRVLGGRYYPACNSFHGEETVEAIELYRPDFCLMSNAAVGVEYTFNSHDFISRTKRKMVQATNQNFLLVHHDKFYRRGLLKTVPLQAFDRLITDQHPPAEITKHCQEINTKITITPSRS